MVVFTFLLLSLASARATRLIVHDTIAFPLRRWIVKRLGEVHPITYLFHCPYCMSVWTSMPAAAVWVIANSVGWVWWLPAVLAMSYLVAPILIRFEQED